MVHPTQGWQRKLGQWKWSPLPFELPQREAIVRGFASLDAFDLSGIFRRRAVVMRSVPWDLRGAFRSMLRIAMEEAIAGLEAFDEVRQDRAWKVVPVASSNASPPACKGWAGSKSQTR